ncbi:MAG: ankyrin repeat domain-containing protein, partial [Cytophagaceae bacterium]
TEGLPRQLSKTRVNARDLLGCSLLHVACLRNLENIVVELLDSGANVSAITKCGRTALHVAAANNNYLICKRLLKYCDRSQVTAADAQGYQAWRYAKHTGILQLLHSRMAESTMSIPDLPNNAMGIVTKTGMFLCLNGKCSDLRFARQADFRRHWENVHNVEHIEYYCTVQGCPRSRRPVGSSRGKSFGAREDKMKEHMRTVHRRQRSLPRSGLGQLNGTRTNNHMSDFADQRQSSSMTPQPQSTSAYKDLSYVDDQSGYPVLSDHIRNKERSITASSTSRNNFLLPESSPANHDGHTRVRPTGVSSPSFGSEHSPNFGNSGPEHSPHFSDSGSEHSPRFEERRYEP